MSNAQSQSSRLDGRMTSKRILSGGDLVLSGLFHSGRIDRPVAHGQVKMSMAKDYVW